MTIAQSWSTWAGSATSGCGTKNDRMTRMPTIAVRTTGTAFFMARSGSPWSLRGHPAGERRDAHGLEHGADHDDRDQRHLHEVGRLERAEEPRLARKVRAGGVELL